MGNFLKRLRRAIRLKFVKRRYHVDLQTAQYLEYMSLEQDRDPQQVAKEIMAEGIAHRIQTEQNIEIWNLLSPREQEVIALVCLGYMNKEIGEKLFISPQTVKSHISHALRKVGARSRSDIQYMLMDWDFSDWDC